MSCASGLTDIDPSAAVTLHQLLVTAGSRLEEPGIWCQWTYTHEPLGLGPSLPLLPPCPPSHIHTQLCINTDSVHLVFSGSSIVVLAYFLNSIWGLACEPKAIGPSYLWPAQATAQRKHKRPRTEENPLKCSSRQIHLLPLLMPIGHKVLRSLANIACTSSTMILI